MHPASGTGSISFAFASALEASVLHGAPPWSSSFSGGAVGFGPVPAAPAPSPGDGSLALFSGNARWPQWRDQRLLPAAGIAHRVEAFWSGDHIAAVAGGVAALRLQG